MSRRIALALITSLLVLAAGCGGPPQAGTEQALAEATAAGTLPADFPADFPLPAGADVTSRGDSVTLTVSSSPEEVTAQLKRELEATGWTTLDDWEGVDPDGAATTGWTVERGEEMGVVAVSQAEDGAIVRVNLSQPFHDPQRGMGLYRQ